MGNKENFRISAALKDLIGRELITDEFVAVFELVKNSFDANAKRVKLIFQNSLKPNEARIIIIDDGKGMNYNDLKEKWLFLAYSAKKLGTENDDYRDRIKVNRVLAGAKGIGRFSCDRLGKYLNLITIKDEPKAKIENLSVDWEDFENADDKDFINIQVDHNELSDCEYDIKHGTILEISGLRDIWDRERLLKLKKSLVKLINPNQENDSANFTIEIIADDEKPADKLPDKKGNDKFDWEIVNGSIVNTVFETLEIKTSKIEVQISEDGRYIETTLQDRGDHIYRLKEKNPFDSLSDIKIFLFYLNRSAKITFHKMMGMELVKYGSVFLYKNGFRVYPFGEEGEDLLKIDRRKQQGYNRFLGTREIIGRIEITGEQPELKETTSRDGGLIRTVAYDNLVDLFYDYVLKRLESYVVKVIKWGDEIENKETKEKSPVLWAKDVKIEILELISGFINSKDIIDIEYDEDFLQIIEKKQDKSVDKLIKNVSKAAERSGNPEIVKEAKKIEKAVRETKEDAQKDRERAELEEKRRKESEQKLEYVIGQNHFLQDGISDDTKSLEGILHHVDIVSSLMRSYINKMTIATNGEMNKDDIIASVQGLSMQVEKILTLSRSVKKAKYNILSKKIKKDIVSFVNEYILNVYTKRKDLIRNRTMPNISIDTPESLDCEMQFDPLEMMIIIDNLIDNSRKHHASNIDFTWSQSSQDILYLSVSDDGEGVKENVLGNIFEFGFTTSKKGSGIGLYHVKKILGEMNATIQVKNRPARGVEFMISIKKASCI